MTVTRMRNREDVAKFITKQLHWKHDCKLEKGHQHHYGKQELRELLDFIYCGEPENDAQKIVSVDFKIDYDQLP